MTTYTERIIAQPSFFLLVDDKKPSSPLRPIKKPRAVHEVRMY
jgi:hypothetical protein